ncbi:serine/threonine-protein kinase [Luteolibacter sp. AS25]|uniref:serine/threonine-protein kinase n=1 Tax=Luteolibacter sp. AS25 TaxID=3135776 RepID=UPI00398BB5CC
MAEESDDYVPDKRLSQMYSEANDLDLHGLEGLCPAYSEMLEERVRYRDESPIGRGALKEVYRIYDQHLHRWVAMAQLREDRGPDFYDLFVREARLVAALSHPNIIKIYNMGIWDDGRPFFTMDLKSNTTLADLTERVGRDELHHQLQVFGKVCDAVAYAHSRGVLHLDLKPDNIQVDDFGEVLVCDWGLGKIQEEAEFEREGAEPLTHIWGDMTLMGQIKGSPGYMAPEQVIAGSRKDHQTDIYALGCILHCILTGYPPFKGDQAEVLLKTEKDVVPAPRLEYPERNIPEGLEAVVMKATARNPEERYESVEHLHEEIESYLDGFSTHAERPGFFREARLFVARNRLPVGILAMALVVIGVTSLFFVQHITRQKLATEVERGRAEQLSSEVEALDFEYSTYMERALDARRKLAISLAASARQLRNLAIYERPVSTIEQTREIIDTALQQDPDSLDAHAQNFATDCVELNYKAALERPPEVRTVFAYRRFSRIAEEFPEFDFSSEKRPSIAQLTELFSRGREIESRLGFYFERVVAYDVATRGDREGYDSVVEAYLQYRSGGPEHLRLSFDPERSMVTLWADQVVRLNGQYGDSWLRFLSFRFLKLDLSRRFELSDLNALPIESLDLSSCRRVEVRGTLELPRLKEIILRRGQIPEEKLRKVIHTTQPFEIRFADAE